MGQERPAPLVKLIVGAFSGESALFDEIKKILTDKFGPVDAVSHVWDFTQTDHYLPEMGPHLQKMFFSFATLIEAGWLPEIKVFTNQLEQQFLNEKGGRRINLDPGYLNLARLVLATTKDYAHRLYLGQGIYGEVTLTFKDGAFQTNPWTYPDYQTPEYREFFKMVRGKLLS